MTRTKLKDREMPVYTKKEEMFNMISHIVGGVVGIAGMVLCIIVEFYAILSLVATIMISLNILK
mgnify:CR=1 FL=1